MSDSANNSSISCSCGKCELVLNERRAKFAALCACEDCRQALSWGASKGGDKPGARLTNEVQFLYDRELQWEQNTISSI